LKGGLGDKSSMSRGKLKNGMPSRKDQGKSTPAHRTPSSPREELVGAWVGGGGGGGGSGLRTMKKSKKSKNGLTFVPEPFPHASKTLKRGEEGGQRGRGE